MEVGDIVPGDVLSARGHTHFLMMGDSHGHGSNESKHQSRGWPVWAEHLATLLPPLWPYGLCPCLDLLPPGWGHPYQ